jgi:ATP-dependent RNA helicase DDX19/DBP5
MADLASRITNPNEDASAGAAESAPAESSVAAQAQVDGAAGPGLFESTYDVEVKLSDLQNDTESPLYSVSTFEQLGL